MEDEEEDSTDGGKWINSKYSNFVLPGPGCMAVYMAPVHVVQGVADYYWAAPIKCETQCPLWPPNSIIDRFHAELSKLLDQESMGQYKGLGPQ